MKRKLLLFVFAIAAQFMLFNTVLNAQKWTGKGDGTSWNDPANWDSNEVPAAGALLKIAKDAVITGTAPNNPAQVKILKNISVTFDLDLTFGDGVINQHCLTVAAGSTLTLGSDENNRVFNFNTPKHAIAVFNSNDDVNIIVAKSTTVNINKAGIGVNIGNVNSTFTNNGTMNIGDEVVLGVKDNGSFVNHSTLKGSNITKSGIAVTGTFNNEGSINLTSLVDTSILLKVDTFGVLTNKKDMMFSGGLDTSSVTVRGVFTNEKDAYFTVNSAGVNVTPTGNFTNTGLTSLDENGLLYTQGTSTNNGFYSYASGGDFSTGPGTIMDNGLSADATIDAAKDCTVDIAEAAYTWYFSGDSLGVAGADGSFTFPAKSVPSDSVVITTSLDGVNITVFNICDDAVEGGCGTVSSPVSLGDQEVCEGDAIPALKVEAVAGYEADWYDTETGGNLLFTGLEFTPAVSDPGVYTYYVENRDADGCVSDRTVISLTINASPVFAVDSTLCADDNNSYSVFLSMDTDYTVEATAGTVAGTVVSGVPVGTDVVVTVTDTNTGCSAEQTVTSPDCTVGTIDLENNNINVYPTLVRNNEINIDLTELSSDIYILNIYDFSGILRKVENLTGGTKNKIYLSGLEQGVYFIKVNTQSQTYNARFFKIN